MPGTPGNVNRGRHGARTQRHGIVLTRFAERYTSPAQSAWQLRRSLESLLAESQGGLSVSRVSLVNLACRYELTARIADWHVAQGESDNPVSDMKTACWAAGMRHRMIEKLGLDGAAVDNADPWDVLAGAPGNGQQPLQGDDQGDPTTETTTEAHDPNRATEGDPHSTEGPNE
ncbi:MAG: hypothetical protein HQ581_02560 [Planctomycetes bacterium]|nr:hypothetical protein [Planctomycetota bacterium]